MKIEKDIIAVGEILFDCYPEYKMLGGAPFNFLYHVWQLSGKGKFVSRVGEDQFGQEILVRLNLDKFDTSFIQRDTEHKTGAVQVKLDENKVPEYIIEENAAYDFIETNDELEKYINEEAELIYIGTLAQRNNKSRDTIQKLSGLGSKVFYDVNLRQKFHTKEILETSLNKSHVVKLNEEELKTVNDLLIGAEFDFVKTAQNVIKKFEIDLLCVTLGEEGATLFRKGEINKHKHTVQNIVDTVGAGDAYSAILCLGYLFEWDLNKINTLASEFAADVCTIKGAVPSGTKFYNKYAEIIKNEQQ